MDLGTSTPPPMAARQLLLGGLLPGLSPDLLSWATPRLTRRMRELRPAPGTPLYAVGDAASTFFLLVEGDVVVTDHDRERKRRAPDETLGWLDAVLERPRTQAARAGERAHLLEIPIADFNAVIEDSLDLSMSMVEDAARKTHALAIASHPDLRRTCTGKVEGSEEDPAQSPYTRVLEALRSAACLHHARMQTLASLASTADSIEVPKGGSMTVGSGALWLVMRGALRLDDEASGVHDVFEAGRTVGGASAFLDRSRPRSAEALCETELLRIDFEDWFDVAEEHFDLVRSTLVWLEEEYERLAYGG